MKYATDNRQALEKSSKCGCVYCCEQYYPIEIEEWTGDTAICPRCGIDAVIPNSLINYTEDDLKRWHIEGFG